MHLEALPCFAAFLQIHAPPPCPSLHPADTMYTVLWFYSLGHWWVSDQSRVLVATRRTSSKNVLKSCGEPAGSTRGWGTGTGKDRSHGTLWAGDGEILLAAQTLRPACCCSFSWLLLMIKSQGPRRGGLTGQGQVAWPFPCCAGARRGRTWPLLLP